MRRLKTGALEPGHQHLAAGRSCEHRGPRATTPDGDLRRSWSAKWLCRGLGGYRGDGRSPRWGSRAGAVVCLTGHKKTWAGVLD